LPRQAWDEREETLKKAATMFSQENTGDNSCMLMGAVPDGFQVRKNAFFGSHFILK
jgi:hypothetical protein